MKLWIVYLILTAMGRGVDATELRLISAEFDPYTYSTPEGGSGVMFEIVQELARRVGQSPSIEFLPWARAQHIAKNESSVGVLPLARVPEREENYLWLIPILNDPYVFFAKKNSKVDISTIEAAKKLRIGIFAGALAELELIKKDFKDFNAVLTDAQNVQMLKAGRIDAWVAPLSFKNRYKKKGGLGEKDLRVGATLIVLNEYFATSKSLDTVTATKWKKAFQQMKQDGSYSAIMKKYGFKPLN